MSHISRPFTNRQLVLSHSESLVSRTTASYATQRVTEDAELRAVREMELKAAEDSKRLWERENRLRKQDELNALGMAGRQRDKDDLQSWMSSEISRKRHLSERIRRHERKEERRKLKRILNDPARVLAYPPIGEEPPAQKSARIRSEQRDMNRSLRHQMDSRQEQSSRMRHMEKTTDQENLRYLLDKQQTFNQIAAHRRAELKKEYSDRWRNEIEAKQLKQRIENEEKKYQEVMYEQSRKQYFDVITGLPMGERAFTPNTTYGDTYRKAGLERKFRKPPQPAEPVIQEENAMNTDYSSRFDILTNKSENKLKEDEQVPEEAEDEEEEVIEIRKGRHQEEAPEREAAKHHHHHRHHHKEERRNVGRSQRITADEKRKLVQERYKQYEQKLRKMDQHQWEQQQPGSSGSGGGSSSQRMKWSLVSPGRLGKKRDEVTFRANVTMPERSRPQELFESKFLSSVERDALKRNIEEAQKKAFQDKRKAWEQQVINYKIDLIDGYRQTDLLRRQMHYYDYLKNEAERKKRQEKEDKYHDFMSAHIQGQEGYPRGPHMAPLDEQARDRFLKQEQKDFTLNQMRQNEKKKRKEQKREKRLDRELVHTDNEAKNMLDNLVALKHSAAKQDMLDSWNKGKQLLQAKRNFEKLGAIPRFASQRGSEEIASVLPESMSGRNELVKKIRSPQASTVKHLMEATSGYMSAEKEREEMRAKVRGNPQLLKWNERLKEQEKQKV